MKKKITVSVIVLCSAAVLSIVGCGNTQQKEQQSSVQNASQMNQNQEECSVDGCHALQTKDSKYCSYHDKYFGKTNKPKHEDTLQAEDVITQSMIDAITQEYEDELNAEAEKQQSESEQSRNVMTEHKDSSGHSSSEYKKPATKKKTATSNSNSSYRSYDDGYDAIYDDGDYDWDRYKTDRNYADGVDDAMDDWDDEYGEDW